MDNNEKNILIGVGVGAFLYIMSGFSVAWFTDKKELQKEKYKNIRLNEVGTGGRKKTRKFK